MFRRRRIESAADPPGYAAHAVSRLQPVEDVFLLFLSAIARAVATGLGALPVFFMGSRAELLRPILLGTAIGAMNVASLVGLLKPAVA